MFAVVSLCALISLSAGLTLAEPPELLAFHHNLPSSIFRQLENEETTLLEETSFEMNYTNTSTLDFENPGESSSPGINLIVLMTSFVTNQNSTGQLWAIYEEDPEAPEIVIQALNKPIGVCVDVNNDYMYIVEQASPDGKGAVYRYEVSWNSKEFDVKAGPVTVLTSDEPTDCDVDVYGNLYVTDATLQRIVAISFLDLETQNYEWFNMYTSKQFQLNTVAALDVDDSGNLYYINGKVSNNGGLINRGRTNITETNEDQPETLVTQDLIGWSIALTPENIFFTASKQGIYGVNLATPGTPLLITELTTPKGMCYADGSVYVADVNTASIYKLSDSLEADADPEVYLTLSNPYALECINSAIIFSLSAVLVLLI
mmetsp:Transcript_24026/g.42679  ORF Transcript_24026/g.42679 Transcript_24026/m.42679 type:complete len:373 (-) Transcript_24026:13-1131(-)